MRKPQWRDGSAQRILRGPHVPKAIARMASHKPRTLLWQLGWALMTVQVVALAALGWYAASTFDQFTHDQTLAEISRVIPLLADRYGPLMKGPPVDPGPSNAIQQLVAPDAAETGLRITVIRPDGVVLADSDHDPATMENHRDREEVATALNGRPGSAVRRSATTGLRTMYVAQPAVIDGRPVGVIRAALPLNVVNAHPQRLIRVIGGAAAASLLFTLTVIYLVSRRLSRTVSRLAEGAALFASGDLSHRIPRPTSQELASLAEALNHMAQMLSDQIDLLMAQRSEQQAIHQSMSNGMIALDLEHRVISVNRAAERLLGLDGESSRGRLLEEVMREPELNRFVDEAIEGRPLAVREFPLRGGGKAGAMIQAASEPLRNARDQPVGVLVFINDVTELRRLESIRSDFAANVSHELRTPITNIKGYVETMLEVGVKDERQTRRFLEIINRNTMRLSSIIEDLLALARLEQPGTKAALECGAFALRRIIEAAAAQCEPDSRAKATIVRNAVPGDLQVVVNAQLMEQAIGNLLSNAIKYSPGGTTVTVDARRRAESGEVEIAVADQGPGIPAEHHDRIFERFYRVDRARSREMGGTGLGLSIVKHIAIVHGGRVEVESAAGKGSTFRIVLPQP